MKKIYSILMIVFLVFSMVGFSSAQNIDDLTFESEVIQLPDPFFDDEGDRSEFEDVQYTENHILVSYLDNTGDSGEKKVVAIDRDTHEINEVDSFGPDENIKFEYLEGDSVFRIYDFGFNDEILTYDENNLSLLDQVTPSNDFSVRNRLRSENEFDNGNKRLFTSSGDIYELDVNDGSSNLLQEWGSVWHITYRPDQFLILEDYVVSGQNEGGDNLGFYVIDDGVLTGNYENYNRFSFGNNAPEFSGALRHDANSIVLHNPADGQIQYINISENFDTSSDAPDYNAYNQFSLFDQQEVTVDLFEYGDYYLAYANDYDPVYGDNLVLFNESGIKYSYRYDDDISKYDYFAFDTVDVFDAVYDGSSLSGFSTGFIDSSEPEASLTVNYLLEDVNSASFGLSENVDVETITFSFDVETDFDADIRLVVNGNSIYNDSQLAGLSSYEVVESFKENQTIEWFVEAEAEDGEILTSDSRFVNTGFTDLSDFEVVESVELNGSDSVEIVLDDYTGSQYFIEVNAFEESSVNSYSVDSLETTMDSSSLALLGLALLIFVLGVVILLSRFD